MTRKLCEVKVMNKKEFTFKSQDNETDIRALAWEPDGEPVGVLQLVHGMVEFIDRYEPLAEFLAGKGWLVVGNDHLGHGKSVTDDSKLGYFAKEDGDLKVVGDLHTLRTLTQEKYPNIPYFMLGHSMGSFLTRQYITLHSEGLAGAIICGTGFKPTSVTSMGMTICKVLAKKNGWMHRSEFVNNMGMGGYNKKFGAKGGKEWLSRNEENVKRNLAEPKCNFCFTLNGYYNLFHSLNYVCTLDNVKKVRKDLPLLFIAGADDPVGDFTKGVNQAADLAKKAGIKDVQVKFYPEDRHEILLEVDKETVFNDVYSFLTDGKVEE